MEAELPGAVVSHTVWFAVQSCKWQPRGMPQGVETYKLRDFYGAGHRAAGERLVEGGFSNDALAAVDSATARLVMEWFVPRSDGTGRVMVQKHRGSAFAIAPNLFLSAGHGIEACLRIQSDASAVSVGYAIVTADGTAHGVNHIHWHRTATADWAVLHVNHQTSAPPLSFARRLANGPLGVAGYPDGFGVDAEGHMRRPIVDATPLIACHYIADGVQPVIEHGHQKIVLLAGTEPIGGLSGGPVFDAHGRALGIQTGVSYRLADDAVLVDFQALDDDDLHQYVADQLL
jgi:hypothetical protein